MGVEGLFVVYGGGCVGWKDRYKVRVGWWVCGDVVN